jgi:hypothetical protein
MRHGIFRVLKAFAKFETSWRFIVASSHRRQRGVIPNAPLRFKSAMRLKIVCLKFAANFQAGEHSRALL